jgi:hypothetical protein
MYGEEKRRIQDFGVETCGIYEHLFCTEHCMEIIRLVTVSMYEIMCMDLVCVCVCVCLFVCLFVSTCFYWYFGRGSGGW